MKQLSHGFSAVILWFFPEAPRSGLPLRTAKAIDESVPSRSYCQNAIRHHPHPSNHCQPWPGL